ncbi:MAG TPA: cyclic nucleotide-binding domain-containing protein [Alphaproteobacteria bacterium]|nr:cyclic nucleotide-binding domain-containing protein [Alphaproteobacteria bacterium]
MPMAIKSRPAEKQSHSSTDCCSCLSTMLSQKLNINGGQETLPRGTTLMTCGEPVENLVILCSGLVEILVPVPGKTKTISAGTAGSGTVFGLGALMSSHPAETTVTCLEECSIARVPRSTFLDLLKNQPQLYSDVIRALSAELKIADDLLRRKARV